MKMTVQDGDEWLKDRIIWRAKKNGLPLGITSIYGDESTLPLGVRSCKINVGIPVLQSIGGEDRWTILGTRGIVSFTDQKLSSIAFNLVKRVKAPRQGQVLDKAKCEFLVIDDDLGGSIKVWVPAGVEYYAIFNILLMLQSFNRDNGEGTSQLPLGQLDRFS